MCVCVCACVRACVRACTCVCVWILKRDEQRKLDAVEYLRRSATVSGLLKKSQTVPLGTEFKEGKQNAKKVNETT